MVASPDTIANMIAVMRKHVDGDTLCRLFNELRKVEGNASFKQTIYQMSVTLNKIAQLEKAQEFKKLPLPRWKSGDHRGIPNRRVKEKKNG